MENIRRIANANTLPANLFNQIKQQTRTHTTHNQHKCILGRQTDSVWRSQAGMRFHDMIRLFIVVGDSCSVIFEVSRKFIWHERVPIYRAFVHTLADFWLKLIIYFCFIFSLSLARFTQLLLCHRSRVCVSLTYHLSNWALRCHWSDAWASFQWDIPSNRRLMLPSQLAQQNPMDREN